MSSGTIMILVAATILFALAALWRARGGVDPDEARALVAQGALLLDVRSPQEFAQGHIDGARNIPHDALSAQVASLGDPATTPVVVYCRSGARSARAASTLRAAGFAKVINLGPMSAWTR